MSVLRLEDFLEHSVAAEEPAAKVSDTDLEATRLAGYEAGYQAGWDDALQSNEREHAHISAEFARNLEELSFTFFEARRQVCLSLKPLVSALVAQVAPGVLQEQLSALIEERLLPLLEDQSVATVDLVCAPEDAPVMEALLARQDRLPVALKTEDSFSQGQVRFVLGHEVHDIDAGGLVRDLNNALDTHFDTLAAEQAHGRA